MIGLEAARRLGRPTVVLWPNTAIQAQWMAQWQASFGPDAVPATARRELSTPLTVLTYQALCTLGAAGSEEEAGGPGQGSGPADQAGRRRGTVPLHPNGRALIARLQAGGPWTLVLDECHHLLELWGRLLQAVVGQLEAPRIVGLTATPPHLMALGLPELALPGWLDPQQPRGLLGRQQPQQVRDQGRVLHLVHPVSAQVDDPAHGDRGGLSPEPANCLPPPPLRTRRTE